MDYFALLLDSICIAGQGVMHMIFAGRLTGKKQKLWHFTVYILLLTALQLISVRLALDGSLSIAVGVLELYAVSRFGMGNQQGVSWLAAVLAFYVSQTSFGIINSIEAALYPHFIGNPLLYPLLLAAQGIFFVLCIGCYHAVLGRWIAPCCVLPSGAMTAPPFKPTLRRMEAIQCLSDFLNFPLCDCENALFPLYCQP